ncbi:MAG: hypothetical protein ISS53_00025 [Dehalococcoidia bacterium]|nr:hypothetical protein [Dehalococcoidia bacterium]
MSGDTEAISKGLDSDADTECFMGVIPESSETKREYVVDEWLKRGSLLKNRIAVGEIDGCS